MEARDQGVTHVPPGGGEKFWVTDELVTLTIVGEDTGGAYALTDSMVPPQGGPPPHIHHREDEAFWVLEGELEFLTAGDVIGAGVGSFVHVPRGNLHTYKNVGTAPARFLTLVVPAGLEKFFEEVGRPGDDVSSPPPPDDTEIGRILAAAPKYGFEIPPPEE